MISWNRRRQMLKDYKWEYSTESGYPEYIKYSVGYFVSDLKDMTDEVFLATLDDNI